MNITIASVILLAALSSCTAHSIVATAVDQLFNGCFPEVRMETGPEIGAVGGAETFSDIFGETDTFDEYGSLIISIALALSNFFKSVISF